MESESAKIEVLKKAIPDLSIEQEGERGWYFVRGTLYFERPSLIAQASTKADSIGWAYQCLILHLNKNK